MNKALRTIGKPVAQYLESMKSFQLVKSCDGVPMRSLQLPDMEVQ